MLRKSGVSQRECGRVRRRRNHAEHAAPAPVRRTADNGSAGVFTLHNFGPDAFQISGIGGQFSLANPFRCSTDDKPALLVAILCDHFSGVRSDSLSIRWDTPT